MASLLWRWLMWRWCRQAASLYGQSCPNGAVFNTSCFEQVVRQTIGISPGTRVLTAWLTSYGMHVGAGGCRWFRSYEAAKRTFSDLA